MLWAAKAAAAFGVRWLVTAFGAVKAAASCRIPMVLPVACGLLFFLPAAAQRGTTVRVSVSSSAGQGNSYSQFPSISADGRYVAFHSWASNLVAGDTNFAYDVFVHDRQTGATTRVSVSSSGEQGNSNSEDPSISADGKYVAFYSYASNLVAGDANGAPDVFVHDRQTGATTRVSVSSSGQQGNRSSLHPSISADGRFVAFESLASNLVAGDTNANWDVFVHDRQTGATTRVSVSSSGQQGNGASGSVDFDQDTSITADGRYIGFHSSASNLVPGDTNANWDVFVHDRQTGATTRVSVSSSGEQGNGNSYDPSISADGRHVAFQSGASNLVVGDTNSYPDVFVHDRQTRTTSRVSVSSGGQQGNGGSGWPSISADGRHVAFHSHASNLVGDTNGAPDVFVHDKQTGATTRTSQGNNDSVYPSISADGRFVAFHSYASNLVVGDTNGYVDVFVHQYGSGEGWGGGSSGSGGNTGGDPPLRDRQQPRTYAKPIVLVHGLKASALLDLFTGEADGSYQWDSFKFNFASAYQSRGYSVYHPTNNPNGTIFVCNTLNTFYGVGNNADRLHAYIQSILTAPAFQNNSEFDIVAYSMGGLIARRWEQRYDGALGPNRERYNVLGKRLGNIVTIATPHQGSPLADLLCRYALCGGLPSVHDLRTVSTFFFNLRNPGLPGTRYSQIGADIGIPPRYILGDGVVPLYSSRARWWVREGFLGSNVSLSPFGHINVTWLGITGVLNGVPSVTAAHDAIFGSGGGDALAPEPTFRDALTARATLLPNQLLIETLPIANAASEAHFSAKWQEGGAEVTLLEPGGRVIDRATAKSDPDIEYFEAGGITAGYVVRKPRAGLWELRVLGGANVPSGGTPCDLDVSDNAECDASPSAPRVVRLGAQGRFLVELRTFGTRLTGGEVSATLLKPDETTQPLPFYDDGNHGDEAAGDGLFGSELVTGSPSGTYAVFGGITGSLAVFGSASRTFTTAFDASPESARITGLAAVRPTDDPLDTDTYYDILNVDINVQVNRAGSYTMAGELRDAQGALIDAVSEVFSATATGAALKTLSFRGAVIGEHDRDGPYTLANVSLTDETDVPVTTDYVQLLGTTAAYSKLDFETIHPRAVAPAGWLHAGVNLISFPLDPIWPYTIGVQSILGPGAYVMKAPAPAHVVGRGRAYLVWLPETPTRAVSYLGTQDDYEYTVQLRSTGAQMIGCPYNRPLPLARCLVRNNATGQVRTAEQDAASSDPWVNWNWSYLQNGVWKTLALQGGDDDHLRPWVGCSVRVRVGGVTLTLRD